MSTTAAARRPSYSMLTVLTEPDTEGAAERREQRTQAYERGNPTLCCEPRTPCATAAAAAWVRISGVNPGGFQADSRVIAAVAP